MFKKSNNNSFLNELVGAFKKMLSLKSLSFCESPTDLSQKQKNFENYGGDLLKKG